MATYTISPDLLRSIPEDEAIYLTDILFVFTNRGNANKVSRDKKGDVLNCYTSVEQNKEVIKLWLDLMSFKPSPFETIDVEIEGIECEETKFLKVCKETANTKKLILYSPQNLTKFECIDGKVDFEKTTIQVLDRDEARIELQPGSGDTIINSQVAKNGSHIAGSENKN